MATEVEYINKRLRQNYGADLLGRPVFRVIWAKNEVEKRIGKWEEWHHGIFLREFSGLKTVPKYRWINERWILEKLVYQPILDLPETSNGHYECIHVFKTVSGEYLPPKWFAVEWLVQGLMFGPKYSEPLEREIHEKQHQKEIAESMDMIQDASPYIAGQLADGEGIAVPHNYERGHNESGILGSDGKAIGG